MLSFTSIFVLGLIIGSFLNVVILRLKAGEQFVKGCSKCPYCQHCLGFWDLIPLLSFIFLKAKCRYCQARISWQYPLVELSTAVLFVIGYHHYLNLTLNPVLLWPQYLVYLVFTCFLIIIFVYDFKYYLILDKVSLTAFILAILFNILLGKPWQNLLLAALAIGGFFLFQFFISKGAWIGGGDIRLGLVMGAMLGWPQVLAALFLAYILGALEGLVLLMAKIKSWKSQLPFGTFLAPATLVVYLWGDGLISWYFNLF